MGQSLPDLFVSVICRDLVNPAAMGSANQPLWLCAPLHADHRTPIRNLLAEDKTSVNLLEPVYTCLRPYDLPSL